MLEQYSTQVELQNMPSSPLETTSFILTTRFIVQLLGTSLTIALKHPQALAVTAAMLLIGLSFRSCSKAHKSTYLEKAI